MDARTTLPLPDPACDTAPRAEFLRGLRAAIPVMVGFLPFALVLGAQAAQKGLSALEVPLMTGLNFAWLGIRRRRAVDLAAAYRPDRGDHRGGQQPPPADGRQPGSASAAPAAAPRAARAVLHVR